MDGNANNDWSTAAANWDAGSVWVNGNNAVFGGAGEGVDVNGAVSVKNITFNTFGYQIGDAAADGTFTLAGTPSVIAVSVSGTNEISEVLAGSGGLTKSGPGVLSLTGPDSPSTGNTLIQAGRVLWVTNDVLPSGSITVSSGATLEWTATVRTNTNRRTIIAGGTGDDGQGALVNNARDHGTDLFNSLTLTGDTTFRNGRRTDVGSLNAAGYTLTKKGVGNFNIRSVAGSGLQKLVVDEGLAQFEGLDAVVPGGIVVQTNAFMSVMANNTDRKMTAEVTLNSANLVANWYFTSATNVTDRFLSPVTVNGNSALIIGVNSPVVLDENSGQANMNMEGPLVGSGNLTLNPAAGGLSNPGAYRLRLLNDNSGLTGTLTVDSGNVDIGSTTGGVTGTLSSGPVAVSAAGTLWLNRKDAQTYTNTFSGTGRTVIRYDQAATFDGNAFGGGPLDVANGSLTLTNGAAVALTGDLTVATKVQQTDDNTIRGEVTLPAGCSVTARAIVGGNDTGSATTELRATVNQTGATVATTGDATEGNGLRLAHYPKAVSVYNMLGGTLTIGGGYDLCVATEGKGWFNLAGGEVFTTRVMLNERADTGGYGKLTVSNGTLNVGAGGITVDAPGPYSVTYGGGGGTVKATADFASPLNAVLLGTGADAAVFDPDGHTITLSGILQGAGELVKAGSGALELRGGSVFTGATRVEAGTLRLAGSGRLLGSANVQVAAGATLDVQTIGNALSDTLTLTVANDGDSGTGVALAAGVAETVGALVLGGVQQSSVGTYGSSASGADYPMDEYFSGAGVVVLGKAHYWDGTDATANADGGNGRWDASAANWDDAPVGGSAVTWLNDPAPNAVFAGAAGVVNVDGSVALGGAAFMTGGYTIGDAEDDGTLTLPGASTLWVNTGLDATISEKLSGTNGFVKAGPGRLTLSATNSLTLSGAVVVGEGTLRWGMNNALPATPSAAFPITVLSGGAVDFGALASPTVNTPRHYLVAGSGVNGNGVLLKTGAGEIYGGTVISSIKLMADSAFGGSSRFDVFGLDLNGYKLTKKGANAIRMDLIANTSGGLDVAEGSLYFEGVHQVFEGPVTVSAGMYLGMYIYSAPQSFTGNITLNGGRIYIGGYTNIVSGSWYGTVTVNGDGSILTGATESGKNLPGSPWDVHVYSVISGSGDLYFNRASITPASASNKVVSVYADNPFAGRVHIQRGTCRLTGDGALRFATGVEVTAGATLEILNKGDTLGETAVIAVSNDVNTATGVYLADGVEEHVARVILGGTVFGEGGGTHGSSASAADHKNDEYFSGTGILVLPRRRGTLVLMK